MDLVPSRVRQLPPAHAHTLHTGIITAIYAAMILEEPDAHPAQASHAERVGKGQGQEKRKNESVAAWPNSLVGLCDWHDHPAAALRASQRIG